MGSTSPGDCQPCKPGTYIETAGQTCKKCPNGTYNPLEKMTSETDCIKCKPGTVNSNQGKDSCTECLEGQYMDEEGPYEI